MLFLPNASVQETENFLYSVEREWQQEHPSTFEFAIVLDDVQIGAVSISLGEITNQGEIGWILNKKYWNQLDIAALDDELFFSLVDHSYDEVLKKLPKKIRAKYGR
jgi:hypothetical protein